MEKKSDLSIQLHSLRGLGSLDAALEAAAGAGFKLVEPVGAYLQAPDDIRRKLDQLGLTAPTCHLQMEWLREDMKTIVAGCKTIGSTYLFVPAVPPEERDLPIEAWPAVGRELGDLANRLADHGITFGYHNHYEVSIGSGTQTGLDLIFEHSAGSPLIWQADVAWFDRCGKDPVDLLTRYRDRLFSIHVKDRAAPVENDPEDNWRVAGQGRLGWPRLWPLCKELGAQYMVMEHDRPLDPTHFAHDAFQAGKTLGGIE